jgi:hypothetical protein
MASLSPLLARLFRLSASILLQTTSIFYDEYHA